MPGSISTPTGPIMRPSEPLLRVCCVPGRGLIGRNKESPRLAGLKRYEPSGLLSPPSAKSFALLAPRGTRTHNLSLPTALYH